MKKDYKYLKIWLLKEGKTIKDFAKYLEISRTHLSAIINGRVFPSKQLDFVIDHSYKHILEKGWE